MSNSVVGSMSDDPSGMLSDIFRQIKDGSLSWEDVRALQEHRMLPKVEKQVGAWQAFYKIFCGQDLSFSTVKIPAIQPGFNRLIIVAKGLTPDLAYEACARHFPSKRHKPDPQYTSLSNDREPTDHYAILVRDRVKADEENKALAPYLILERKLATETLLERMIHELKFWSETGEHLDRDHYATLCCGSYYSCDSVACCHWSNWPQFEVDLTMVNPHDGYHRARSVIVL